MKIKILHIGRTEYLFDSIIALSAKYECAGIITAPASPEYAKNENDFLDLAKKIGSPFLLSKTIDEKVIAFIKEVKPDIAVSVNWVTIISKNVLDIIPLGILNAHFGDLPKYRGNAVVNWALLNFEKEITLTIHSMEADELDCGKVVIQKKMKLNKTTTINDIVEFCREHTPKLFLKAILPISEGYKLKYNKKNISGGGFRCYPRLPIDSKINWNDSAKNINALVRASTKPYMGAFSYLKLDGEIKKVFIWKSKVISQPTKDMGVPGHIIRNDKRTGESYVYTGKGILALQLISIDDHDIQLKPAEIFKSIRIGFGIDIEEEIISINNRLKQLESR